MRIFVPMDENGQPLQSSATTATPEYGDRRRYTRHRLSAQVEIRRKQELNVDAMMFELSEGGMSAATANILAIGETVEISPVAGQTARAIVRRKHGAMYGFEFVGLSEDFRERIRNICRGLPLFTSMLDV
ncbi:MAG TPA: PilZ domain-containing protein [Methylomirabilota bacterium]|nr:PilZ domain-containing protein [Methylomirabilota bacterium]